MKKIIVSLLILCISLSVFGINVFAARYYDCAETLEELGVFKGVGIDEYDGSTIFDLERGAKRVEALVMLIRLLGEEELAFMCEATHNFGDVLSENWAYKYVAYAFEKAYTSGTSDTTFSPDSEININAFATFLLRTLGYNDRNGDFDYSTAVSKAEEIGLLIKGTYADGNSVCLRDDCAYMSLRALNTKMKDSDKTLCDKLVEKGVIPAGSDTIIKETLTVADKNITDAYINNNMLNMENSTTYAEYEHNGKIVKKMEHIFYGNPFAKYLSHYIYDKTTGNLIREMHTDSAATPVLYENTYDEKGNLIKKEVIYIDTYSVIGDLDYDVKVYDDDNESYIYMYTEDGRLAKISDENSDEYLTFEYDGDTVIIRPTMYFDTSYISFDFPDMNRVVVYDGYGNLDYINNFNAEGMLISSYDENNRPTYLAELDDNGKYKKIEYYTYVSISDSPMYSGSSGSDSYTIEEYIYNENGSLKKIVQNKTDMGYSSPREEFTFRYFGNGKLERVLWKMDKDDELDDSGITWEQTYTVFDEYGHMKAPY